MRSITTAFLLSVMVVACSPKQETVDIEKITNGYDLIRAMNIQYQGKWYDKLFIEQKIEFFKEGKPYRDEVSYEYLMLPGKARNYMGDPEEGNYEIYLNDSMYVFQSDSLVHKQDAVYPLLVLGFDVYLQKPEKTFKQLNMSHFNMKKMHLAEWRDRPVFVVGAAKGDDKSPQFWIDKERLYCVRVKYNPMSKIQIDIELNEFKPLNEAWIATHFTYKRNGELIIVENYLDYSVPDNIDPELFNVVDHKKQ